MTWYCRSLWTKRIFIGIVSDVCLFTVLLSAEAEIGTLTASRALLYTNVSLGKKRKVERIGLRR